MPNVELPDPAIPHRISSEVAIPSLNDRLAPPDTPYRKPRLNRSNTDFEAPVRRCMIVLCPCLNPSRISDSTSALEIDHA